MPLRLRNDRRRHHRHAGNATRTMASCSRRPIHDRRRLKGSGCPASSRWSGRQVFTAADRFPSPYYQYLGYPHLRHAFWVHGAGRFRTGTRVCYHPRCPVRGQPLVPRPGYHAPDAVTLPGPGLLPASACGACGSVGRHDVAVGAGALAHPARTSVRQLPRRRRGRRA